MLGEKKIFSELLTQWYFIFTITCKLLLKFQVTSVAATYWDHVSRDEKQLQPRLRERLARCSRSTFALSSDECGEASGGMARVWAESPVWAVPPLPGTIQHVD